MITWDANIRCFRGSENMRCYHGSYNTEWQYGMLTWDDNIKWTYHATVIVSDASDNNMEWLKFSGIINYHLKW
jgi:hypothetical protein